MSIIKCVVYVGIIFYSLVIIVNSSMDHNTSHEKYIQICEEHSEMTTNQSMYEKWYRPDNYYVYCISWLFYQYPGTQIHPIEVTQDDQILSYKLSIVSRENINLDLLHQLPFGKIQSIQMLQKNGCFEYVINWQMLDIINTNILDYVSYMDLSVHAIMHGVHDKDMHIKILVNNQWFSIREYPSIIYFVGYPFAVRVNEVTKNKLYVSVTRSDGTDYETSLHLHERKKIFLINTD